MTRFEIGLSRTTWLEEGIVQVLERGAHSIDLDWPVFSGRPPRDTRPEQLELFEWTSGVSPSPEQA
jgi:hypothetical protein